MLIYLSIITKRRVRLTLEWTATKASTAIAGTTFLRASLAAFRFALVGFTLPFMFVFRPQLLMLDAGGEADVGLVGELEQVTGEVGSEVQERLVAEIALRVGDEVEHLLGERAGAVGALTAEEVERHAVGCRGANGGISQRDRQLGDVV